MPDTDADAMKAEIPLLEENPIPENNMQKQVLGALEKLDKRLNSLETMQTQPEKPYNGTASESVFGRGRREMREVKSWWLLQLP